MAAQPDPYVILGIARDATPEQITRAYRAALRRYHSDPHSLRHNPASDAAVQQVILAYRVLGHANRRAAYDRQTESVRDRHEAVARASSRRARIRAMPARWRAARASQAYHRRDLQRLGRLLQALQHRRNS